MKQLTESGNARSEQLLMVLTESLINRIWLEWIRTSKARLVFRYEISDLFQKSSHLQHWSDERKKWKMKRTCKMMELPAGIESFNSTV